jgi:LacI family transcriptional regulator
LARIKTGRPTIVDVAELAGVSVATVSRALNGRGEVHADTRKAVNAAAERLNFAVKRRAPDQAGRTIGLLTSDPGRFSMSILEGAEDALGAGKIEVLLCATRNDPIREAHYVTTLVGRDVDGIIVVGSRTNSRHPLDVVSPIPIVYAFAPSDDPRDISFAPDDIEGGRMATRHLLDLGRRHIAHITGPEEWSSSGDRAKGCLEELRSHGHELVGQVMYGSEWSQYISAKIESIWVPQAAAIE